jgi:hypothetical protein
MSDATSSKGNSDGYVPPQKGSVDEKKKLFDMIGDFGLAQKLQDQECKHDYIYELMGEG